MESPTRNLSAVPHTFRLLSSGAFFLEDDRLDRLMDACNRHDQGQVAEDPTTGVCWDADRLNLWRVGTTPDPRLLSTAAGRDQRLIAEAASFHGLQYSWEDLFAGYAQLAN